MIIIPLLSEAYKLAAKIPQLIKDEVRGVHIQADENARYNFAKNVLEYLH